MQACNIVQGVPLVKPAKMLMMRSFPMTSEMLSSSDPTLLPSPLEPGITIPGISKGIMGFCKPTDTFLKDLRDRSGRTSNDAIDEAWKVRMSKNDDDVGFMMQG